MENIITIKNSDAIEKYLSEIDSTEDKEVLEGEVTTSNSIDDTFKVDTNSLAVINGTGLVGVGYSAVTMQLDKDQGIELPKVLDTTGEISSRISEIERILNCSVLPFSITGVAPCVVSLREHDIITIDGALYSSNNTESLRVDILDEYINNVVNTFAKFGRAFSLNLMKQYNNGENSFLTCIFSTFEIKYVLSKLVNLKAQLYKHEITGHMKLIIGDFY